MELGCIILSKNIPFEQRQQSLDLITEHLREIGSITITIPLNSPICKKIHTNMMIRTKFSTPELQNMKAIGEIVRQTSQSRNSVYTKNVWYVEKIDIENSPSQKTMKLTLNPFPVGLGSYNKLLKDFRNTEKRTTTTTNAQTNKTVTKTKTKDLKLHNVKGFSKEDNAFIKKQVQKAIGTCSTDLARAKAIDEHFKNNHKYAYYNGKTKLCRDGFKKSWGKDKNCGDGAVTMWAMFKCAGLDADILLTYDASHYIVRLKIDGKTYYTDQAGEGLPRNPRKLGKTWHNYKSGNVRNGRCE